MIAIELVNQVIPPLKSTDTVKKAIQWMEEFRVSQLPLIDKQEYRGLILESVLYDCNDENAMIDTLEIKYEDTFVYAHQYFFEILKLAKQQNIQVLAVLDEKEQFCGVVTLNDAMNVIAESSGMQEPGGILEFLMDKRNYSLTEISRYVEENGAKILNVHITDDKIDRQQIKVTIKINTTNLARIVSTFERHDYQVTGKYQDDEAEQALEKDRLDMLFKYYI
jgi:acetoin utilization protein AcuB